jgi:hypothetical protein
VSDRQFGDFRASTLYCKRCDTAQKVRERLLLVLPDREMFEYLCAVCGDSVGTREVTAADSVAKEIVTRRTGRQVRIL